MRAPVGQFVLAMMLAATPLAAQDKDQPPKAPPAGESSSQPSGPATAPKSDAPAYDPVSAEQDIEIGTFYMHKGDIDAAISRFQDAIRLRSNFAKPRLLAAEAYEKKGDKVGALKYYKEYLQVFPKAPDAKKIQNRIERLSGE